MTTVLWIILLAFLMFLVLLLAYLRKPIRQYEGPESVAAIYDQWTGDPMLEHYWGGHMHAGYYGDPPAKKAFIVAKNEMVDNMLNWGLAIAPHELTKRLAGIENSGWSAKIQLLDVGCGLGATMRLLAQRWPDTMQLTGITLSAAQARRANKITQSAGITNAEYVVADALFQSFPTASFDIVWALESEPHMPDKGRFIQEMVRLLKPGGVLMVGTWNVRDSRQQPFSKAEAKAVQFLLDEWNHASFVTMPESLELYARETLEEVGAADWTVQTIPTWREATVEPFRRPGVMLHAWKSQFSSIWRDGFTILRFDHAFRQGLLQYGLYRGRKAAE